MCGYPMDIQWMSGAAWDAIHDFYERRIVVIQVGPTMLLYSR